MKWLLVIAVLSGCEREQRTPPSRAPSDRPPSTAPNTELYPGGKPNPGGAFDPSLPGYAETAQALSNGRKLYYSFNCVGCHQNGGGGIGPALMDERWIYGSTPSDIATSVIAGRPDGMPSYRGKIVPQQLQEIVAYVRSLGGLVRTDSLSARQDHAQTTPPPTLRDMAVPQPSRPAP